MEQSGACVTAIRSVTFRSHWKWIANAIKIESEENRNRYDIFATAAAETNNDDNEDAESRNNELVLTFSRNVFDWNYYEMYTYDSEKNYLSLNCMV